MQFKAFKKLAQIHGQSKAILLCELIDLSSDSNYIRDGKKFISITVNQIYKNLNILSERQIKRLLVELIKDGFLIKKDYSVNRFKKVNFYSVRENLIFSDKSSEIDAFELSHSTHEKTNDLREGQNVTYVSDTMSNLSFGVVQKIDKNKVQMSLTRVTKCHNGSPSTYLYIYNICNIYKPTYGVGRIEYNIIYDTLDVIRASASLPPTPTWPLRKRKGTTKATKQVKLIKIPEKVESLAREWFKLTRDNTTGKLNKSWTVEKWGQDIHKIMTKNDLDIDTIFRIFNFLKDDDFWKTNCLVPSSLDKISKTNGLKKYQNILNSINYKPSNKNQRKIIAPLDAGQYTQVTDENFDTFY